MLGIIISLIIVIGAISIVIKVIEMLQNRKSVLKIKKLSTAAVIPKKTHPTDAGADMTATSMSRDGNIITYGTDIAIQLPKGTVGLMFPRSSIYKKNLRLTNCVGVVDQSYTGEIKFKFDIIDGTAPYNVGDRIGQLVIMDLKEYNTMEVTKLDDTDRGSKGWGSSGQ